MHSIILAGGQGTRLREAVSKIPKPMAPIKGKPFLEYLVVQLKRAGIEEIILAVGYMYDKVIDYFGNGANWGVKIAYSIEHESLGTGGALKKAAEILEPGPVVVLNGDSFVDVNIAHMLSFHKDRAALTTIALVMIENAERYGMVDVDSHGQIMSFSEKRGGVEGLINSGVYIVEKGLVEAIPVGKVSLEEDIFPMFVGKGLYGFITKGFFIDIGIPQDYFYLKENPVGIFLQ